MKKERILEGVLIIAILAAIFGFIVTNSQSLKDTLFEEKDYNGNIIAISIIESSLVQKSVNLNGPSKDLKILKNKIEEMEIKKTGKEDMIESINPIYILTVEAENNTGKTDKAVLTLTSNGDIYISGSEEVYKEKGNTCSLYRTVKKLIEKED